MMRIADRSVIVVASAVLIVGAPVATAEAQSAVHLQLSAVGVNARDSSSCQWSAVARQSAATTAGATPDDTLYVEVFDSATYKTHSTLPIPVEIRVGRTDKGTLPRGDSTLTLNAGPAGLQEEVISIWPAKSTAPVCVTAPLPHVPSFANPKPFTTQTDIIASGEISNALHSGSTTAPATGSLGFHHQSFPHPDEELGSFPWVWFHKRDRQGKLGRLGKFTSYPVRGEDLRAVVSVAGNTDSVTGPAGANFAQAVLAPTTVPSASWKSLDLEYWPFMEYGRHQRFGLAGRFSASQSRWAPDSIAGGGPLKTKSAVLIGLDARVRWMPINRVSATDENSLSLTFDGGYIQRSIGGDVKNDVNYVTAGLGQRRTRFRGLAFGTYLRLRQVTAFADLECLSCWPFARKGAKIESLEGLQPLIGFRFEAPFITVPEN